MKKYILLVFVIFLFCGVTVSAAGSYPAALCGKYVYRVQSSVDGKLYLGLSTEKRPSQGLLFMIPAADVPDGASLIFDAPSSCLAAFFWSSVDLTSVAWPSPSLATSFFLDPTEFELLAGDFSNFMLSYPEGTSAFGPVTSHSSGFYYVSVYLSTGYSALSSLSVSVQSPEPTPTPTAEPTPEPTPEPTAEPMPEPTPAPTAPPFSEVSGPSESLGTFGTADGTQTEAYESFMRLYNKLLSIVTDDSVPDPAPSGYFPDLGAQSSGTYAAALYGVDQPAAYAAEYDTDQVSASALVDKWLVRDKQTLSVGESWSLSPYSVEVAETGATLGQEYRDGNSYILHYRLRLPVRFNFMGHTGSGLASPQIIAGLSIAYDGDPAGSFLHSFGTPSVSLVQDASRDLLCTLGFKDGGLSGTVGAAFNNIPVLDWTAQTSYELLVEFPLYISALSSPTVFPNSFQYEVTVTLDDLEFSNLEFIHVSDQASSSVLEGIAAEQKKQHDLENERYEQEQETIQEANGTAADGLAAVTETLSSWEIFTMPVTVTKDFVTAIASSNSAQFTFPSFSLMGHTLWPSYSFDLNKVKELFPFLYNSLHLISGILVVIWFLRYLWRKWALITGDDLPDGEVK